MDHGPSTTSRTRARAEAAAWLARLQSEARDATDEAGFRRWLAQEDAHREAFDNVTSAWELAGGLAADYAPPPAVRPARRGLKPLLWTLAACLAVAGGAVALGSAMSSDKTQAYATGPGEDLVINLDGGGKIALGADSHLRIDRREGATTYVLENGSARFLLVAGPFTHPSSKVIFGRREIEARKAQFDVSYRAGRTTVALTGGQAVISVREAEPPKSRSMALGERVIFHGDPTP